MQAELEMWWPWFDSLADDEVLHCLPANRPRPRDRECLRDRASQDLSCGHASATVVADSAAAPRRDLLWLWVSFYLCVHCLMQRGTGIGWVMLSLLSCYLIAWGAPEWSGSASGNWETCLQQACELQASLHQGWWCQGLADDLPSSTPAAYHLAWQLEPRWQGGPPDSILVATDGSGENNGAWAFVAWGMSKGRWRRMGWAAATLPATPWLAQVARASRPVLRSYYAELAALQAAAHWCAAMCDL